MNVKIADIELYLPEKVITNEYLHNKCGIDIDFLENKIGIKERRIAAEDETCSDMAIKAAQNLFAKGNYQPNEIDVLIVCTQNPDYKLPTTACIIQHSLGLKTSCMSFDINLGCSGYIYSLVVAQSLLNNGIFKKALVIMVDQYSKLIDYTDKNTAALFGDAATVTVVEASEKDFGIIDFTVGTDGSGAQNLIAYNSGVKTQSDKNKFLYMNGREIFKFSLLAVPVSINTVLEKNNLTKNEIKYFIFHQANKYMLGEIKKKLDLTDEQVVIAMENYGNTVSSTIPIALKGIINSSKVKKGDFLILCGFGVGLSWGTILYKVD